MPAPQANTNAIRHGLTAGKLPPKSGYIVKTTSQFRAALEAATLEARGQVGVFEAATIQTAVRWERHALLAQRWLRNNADDLTPDQRLSFSREVAKASAERDKCLRSLGLHRTQSADILTALYGPYADANASTDAEASEPTEATAGAA